MRADFKNTKVGDQIVFKKAGEWHYFRDRIENAKKLEEGKIYTVTNIIVASSSTGVKLQETGELEYELGWFEHLKKYIQLKNFVNSSSTGGELPND